MNQANEQLTEIERNILDYIQCDFPVEPRPFLKIAKDIGITEDKCINILKNLSVRGILRSIRAVISWNKLGLSTVLVGMSVKQESIDEIARQINHLNGVTHNYERDGVFNLWFTLIYKDNREKESIFLKLRSFEGVMDLREFIAEKTYKIGLVLNV